MKKRMIAFLLLLSAALLFSSCRQTKNHEEGITTSFDSLTGTLTVSGEGAIEDLYPEGSAESKLVRRLVIEEGIAGIWNSFNDMAALKKIQLPSTLTMINGSFNNISVKEKVSIPPAVWTIEDSFCFCSQLKNLELGGAVNAKRSFNTMGIEQLIIPAESKMEDVFNYCKNLKEIVIEPNAYVEERIYFNESDLSPEADSSIYNYILNFSESGDDPRVYLCLPKGTFDHSLEKYQWIEVPEGESWEDYRNAPAEKIG